MNNETICKKYKIFIDTCSLLNNNFEQFFISMKADLLKNNNQLIVPYSVVVELNKHSKMTSKPSLSVSAKKALKIIKLLLDLLLKKLLQKLRQLKRVMN